MKKLSSKKVLQLLKEYALVTLAAILNSISLFTFVNPSKLIAGGFSGLSSTLTYVVMLFTDVLPFDKMMSLLYFVLNVPLLICSLIFLRGDFTVKTIWNTIVSTITLAILPQELKFEESRLIAIIFGGILVGMAMYVAYLQNGSNGGTEIIARIVAKYRPEQDISKIILLANFAITIMGSVVVMLVQGENFTVILYSIMYVLMGGNILGILKRGFNHPQKFLIITTEYDQISADIDGEFKRGHSVIELENSYDGKKRKMIMVIVQYRQMHRLKQIVKYRDPHAFTIVKDVHDVFSRPTFNRSYKTK